MPCSMFPQSLQTSNCTSWTQSETFVAESAFIKLSVEDVCLMLDQWEFFHKFVFVNVCIHS